MVQIMLLFLACYMKSRQDVLVLVVINFGLIINNLCRSGVRRCSKSIWARPKFRKTLISSKCLKSVTNGVDWNLDLLSWLHMLSTGVRVGRWSWAENACDDDLVELSQAIEKTLEAIKLCFFVYAKKFWLLCLNKFNNIHSVFFSLILLIILLGLVLIPNNSWTYLELQLRLVTAH